jgi:hypothetical protein
LRVRGDHLLCVHGESHWLKKGNARLRRGFRQELYRWPLQRPRALLTRA